MKPFLKLLIHMTGVALFHSIGNTFGSSAAIAQQADGCFMVNASGQMVNLSNLCGDTAKKASTNPKVFQAKIKRRESGVPVIEVTFNAKHKFEMLLDTGASRDVVESSVGRVDSIRVGNAIVNEPTVLIGAFPLLGQNFFGEYDVIIRKDVVEFHAR